MAAFAPLQQPLAVGIVWGVLRFYPDKLDSLLFSHWLPVISSPSFLNILWAIFVVLIISKANSILSSLYHNNFTTDKWQFGKEICIVTGGSSGIGEAIVRKLAKSSSAVIIFDIQPPLSTPPPNVSFHHVDITEPHAIHAAATSIRSQHGDPTVLINNAGIGNSGDILSKTAPQIRQVFDINTISHYFTVQEFLPAMLRQNHGHVVTIASAASFTARASAVAYSCSKASALAFHEGLTQELRSRYKTKKVRTTIVHPSFVLTPMIQKAKEGKPLSKRRLLDAEDVAEAVVTQLYSGMGGRLLLPWQVAMTAGMRAFPGWLQEWLSGL